MKDRNKRLIAVSSDQLALSIIAKLYREKKAIEQKDARTVTVRDYKTWQRLRELEKLVH